MEFLSLAKERYSCRKFDSRPVEQEKIDKIVETAMAAPTACNMQPFKIWEITSPQALEKLAQATPFLFDATTVLVVGGDFKKGYVRSFDNKNFTEIDASIVATHIMLSAHDLGLGTTWVGYIDDKKLKEEFPEFAQYDIVAIFPIGYPAKDVTASEMHYTSKSKEELFSVI